MGQGFLAYAANYLVKVDDQIVMAVKATTAIRQAGWPAGRLASTWIELPSTTKPSPSLLDSMGRTPYI